MVSSKIVLIILLAFLIIVRLLFHLQGEREYEKGEEIKITHSFLKETKKNSYGQYFFTSNILVSIPNYPRYYYGDTIEIKGRIESKITDRGSFLIINNPTITKIEKSNPFLFISRFVRGRIEESVTKVLPTREAGLFLGIVLGVRDKIDSEFYESLKGVGVLHIIAASGQNVTILASIILVAMERLVKRKNALLFTGLMIAFYASITGFDPPIIRASVMALISFGALANGKQRTGLSALFITGWAMVMIRPDNLSDVSFQLSFLSTFGIITVKPLLDGLLDFKLVSIVKDDFTTTLSAQIATFPLMIAVFGSYSLITLPVNLLILWMIPIIMVVGIVGSAISIILPLLAYPFILLSFPFLAYFNGIVDLFSKLQMVIDFDKVPTAFIYGYYLILIAIVIKLKSSERRKI